MQGERKEKECWGVKGRREEGVRVGKGRKTGEKETQKE